MPLPITGSAYKALLGEPWTSGSEFICWLLDTPVGKIVLKEPRKSRWRTRAQLDQWYGRHQAIADIHGIVPVSLREGPHGPYLLQWYYGPTVSDAGNLPHRDPRYREQMSRLLLSLVDRGYRLEDTMTKNCCWVNGRLYVVDTGHLALLHRSRHGKAK